MINKLIAVDKPFKTPIHGILAALHLLENFGGQKLNYMKPFFTEIEKKAKIATQPKLKKVLIDFYKKTYQWIGQAIMPFVEKLKKVHIKELTAYFDSYKQVDMIPKRGSSEVS